MRDLKADLKLCEAVRPGPWATRLTEARGDGWDEWEERWDVLSHADTSIAICWDTGTELGDGKRNATFIAEAREGWPEAIRRAIKAEKECTELRTVFEEMTNTIDSAIRYCISGDCDGTLDPRTWCELISKARQILGE